MLALQMTVTYIDDHRPSKTVTVLPVSQVAFERHFKMSFAAAFSEAPSIEHTYFLAWHSSHCGVEFDEWLATVSGIDMAAAEAVDPTSPAVSAGP